MTKFSIPALALGAAAAAVSPRSEPSVLAPADDGTIDATKFQPTGSISIINGCKRNVYIRHAASDKTITLVPSALLQDVTRADKGDKTYTYKIGINDNFEGDSNNKEHLPSDAAVLGLTYRSHVTAAEAGAVAHVYRILGNPMPGQNVSISIAASASCSGAAAAAAAAGGNHVGARASVHRAGASGLGISMTLCADGGSSPDEPISKGEGAAYKSFVADEVIPDRPFSDLGITKYDEWSL